MQSGVAVAWNRYRDVFDVVFAGMKENVAVPTAPRANRTGRTNEVDVPKMLIVPEGPSLGNKPAAHGCGGEARTVDVVTFAGAATIAMSSAP